MTALMQRRGAKGLTRASRNSYYRGMLTALLDALINFIEVLVGWLVDVAGVLEATPFSFAWPLLLALLLQVLLAAVSGVV
jgi:hypothetical protein